MVLEDAPVPGGCCGGGNHCFSAPPPRPIGDDCCSRGKETQLTSADEAEKTTVEVDDCCAGSDHGAPARPLADQCCQDGSAERCDDECVKTLAAYECEAACNEEQKNHQEPHHDHELDPHAPCGTHLSAAFERYLSYLNSARCICRSVVNRRVDSCRDKRSEPSNTSGAPVIFATASGYHHSAGHARTGLKKRTKCGQKHCKGAKSDPIAAVSSKTAHAARSNCSDFVPHDQAGEKTPAVKTATRRIRPDDVEKAAGLEKVVLTVQGMTCSGCDTKLTRTLASIPGVSNIRVTFVMGSADFDLDSSMMSLEAVLRAAEKGTGFKCARIESDDQCIDLLMTSTAAESFSSNMPLGVQFIERLDKRTVRVTYDPTVVGARSLLPAFGLREDGIAPLRPDSSLTSGRKRLKEMLISTSLAAVFTIPVVVLAWGDLLSSEPSRAYVSIVLATLVQGLAVPEFYIPAISSLIRSQSVEMDLLVVISITAAYVYSVVAFGFTMADRPLETREFFETSTLLVTLVLFGRLIATFARLRAVQAVSQRSLQPTTAMLVDGDRSRKIDARLLQFGDLFMVPAHAQVPTDGQIIEGSSELDESMLTGESLPVAKAAGDQIIAGTINGGNTLSVRLVRLPGKNTVTDIAQLVMEASSDKTRVQDLADKVAGWFVPVVTSIAVIVIIVWAVIGVKTRDYSVGRTVSNAMTYAITVLAVACPCALGLAVPMVLVVAGGVAARGGVIIKSAESSEMAHRVNNVVFDKTGTLTTGELDVVVEEYLSDDHAQVASLVHSLVRDNNHPVSAAVARHLSTKSYPVTHCDGIQIIPGAGVKANCNGSFYRAGNAHWLGVAEVPEVERLLQQGITTLCVTQDSRLIAVFGLRSTLRLEAAGVVRELQRRKIEVHLVSGDQKTAVEAVALDMGIKSENVAARKSPAEKRVYVQEIMRQGKTVLFCGDGTNDAVAVAQANVGVQMGTSSDVTRATADVILLSGLDAVVFLLDVSKAAFYRIVFNFIWAAVYNVLAISLAAGAFVRIRIPPAYAGLGEIVSVLPVIAAATTMSGMKRKILD